MLIFIQKKGKGIAYVEHKGKLNEVADNWKSIKTVKTIGKYMFIKNISFDYFLELARNKKIPFTVKTEL